MQNPTQKDVLIETIISNVIGQPKQPKPGPATPSLKTVKPVQPGPAKPVQSGPVDLHNIINSITKTTK